MDEQARSIENILDRLKRQETKIDALSAEIRSVKVRLAADGAGTPAPADTEGADAASIDGGGSPKRSFGAGPPEDEQDSPEARSGRDDRASTVPPAHDMSGGPPDTDFDDIEDTEPGVEPQTDTVEDASAVSYEASPPPAAAPRKRPLFWLAIPVLVVAAFLAGYFAPIPKTRSKSSLKQSSGTESDDAIRIARTLTDSENMYTFGDYDGCRSAILGSPVDLGVKGQELLIACKIMSEPAAALDQPAQPNWARGLGDLLRSDVRWRLRQIAARKLAELGRPRSLQALSAALLSDPDWGVRCEAADSLGRLAQPAALEPLRRSARSDPEELVRMAAESSIAAVERAAAPHPAGAAGAANAPPKQGAHMN